MHKNDELQFFLAEVLNYNAIAYKYNSVIYRQYWLALNKYIS